MEWLFMAQFFTSVCEAFVSATVCKGRGRGKVVPVLNQVPGHEDAFLTSALDADEWSASCPSHFIPQQTGDSQVMMVLRHTCRKHDPEDN
jgi:hypothetical protein